VTDTEPSPKDAADAEALFEQAKPAEAQLPTMDFAGFVLSLSHSALIHLGDAPHPGDDKVAVDLSMARHTIDLLALLSEKTQNNLTGEEERILGQALYDLRMRYVELAKSRSSEQSKKQ
jgi:hypothetical protein